jgi:hypothetical protein
MTAPKKWLIQSSEKYVEINPFLVTSASPVFPSFDPPVRLTDFWDTAGNPSSTGSIGLAEFINANYFSDSTIPSNGPTPEHTFPYPNINGSGYRICTDYAHDSLTQRRYISRKPCTALSKRPMGFAGLYNTWKSPEGESICTCSIITTEANHLLSPIHDRMPAIISEDNDDIWLGPNISDKERLMPLLRPYSDVEMEFYDVSPMVNKPGSDSPDLIESVKGYKSNVETFWLTVA